MNRAIDESCVGPAGMKAIDLAIIRAVDGTRPWLRGPVGGRALAEDQGPRNPDATAGVAPRSQPARTPLFRPARAFGDQDRLRSAVRNLGEARQAVWGHIARRQDAHI